MPVHKKTNTSPEQKKKGISVSNQVKLGKNPIPFEYGGDAFSYVQGSRYSPFLYPDDNYAKTLLEAKTLSVTHNACVETKKIYCAGRGLYDVNGKDFSSDVTTWLKRLNIKGESQFHINRKAFGSFFTFGNIPVEIVRLTVMGKKKLFIYVHSILKWRLGWPDTSGNITYAIHSRLFLRSGITASELLKEALVLPLYDPERKDSKNWLVDKNGVERTMIWIKNDMDGYETYGMPSSIASLMYQVLEYKAARYNMDNFDNNMVVGGLLALKGTVSQDEANRIGRSLIQTHSGDGNRGRIIVVASEEGQIEGSEFHQYETQKEGSFVESDSKVMDKIILANEWSSLLAGLPQAGSMGKGNTYFRTEYEIKKKTVIDPAQDFIANSLWIPVFEIAAKWLGKNFDGYDLGILDIDPVSVLSEVDPTNALQLNELRTAIGLPLDNTPKGKMYMFELAPSKSVNKGGGNV